MHANRFPRTMQRRPNVGLLSLLALLLLFLATGEAWAQAANDPSGQLEGGILDLINNRSQQWAPILLNYARVLFWSLALIEFVWALSPLVFKGADLGEIVGDLVRVVLTIGFFLFLLEGSVMLATAITDSMQTAGANAAGVGRELRPGQVLDRGVDLALIIMDTDVGMNPLTAVPAALAVTIAGAVILLCFGFIAAFIAITLVESWIIIYGGVIFMGFGGARWTREFAIAVLRYALSVGAKLFVMVLIVGIVSDVAVDWANAYEANPDKASMWTIVALAGICAYLVKTIPDLIQGMVNGTSMGGGGQLGAMAAGGMAAAVAGVAAMKVASASSGSGGGGLADKLGASLNNGQSAPGGAMAPGGASAPTTGVGSRLGGGGQATPSPAGTGGSTPAPAPTPGTPAAPAAQATTGGAPATAPAPTSTPGATTASRQGPASAGGAPASAPATPAAPAQPAQTEAPANDVPGTLAAAADRFDARRSEASAGADWVASTPDAPAQASGAGQQGESKSPSALAATAGVSETLLRMGGSLAAMSVPGMEQAPGIMPGGGAPQAEGSGEGEHEASQAPAADAANVIRPVDAGAAAPPSVTPPAAPAPQQPAAPPAPPAPPAATPATPATPAPPTPSPKP